MSLNGTDILKQHFTYYNESNNVKEIDDGQVTKNFDYDNDNQLTRSTITGKFAGAGTRPPAHTV